MELYDSMNLKSSFDFDTFIELMGLLDLHSKSIRPYDVDSEEYDPLNPYIDWSKIPLKNPPLPPLLPTPRGPPLWTAPRVPPLWNAPRQSSVSRPPTYPYPTYPTGYGPCKENREPVFNLVVQNGSDRHRPVRKPLKNITNTYRK